MSEPAEPQAAPEPETPAEAPETPAEPPDEPDRRGAEDGDPPQTGPLEHAIPVEKPQGTSEKDIEKAMEKLSREARRHRDRIGEIMGEDALALQVCELCWPPAPGFRFPQVPEDQKAAVMMAIGFDPEPDLRPDEASQACPKCDGYGLVATGSKVKGQDALPCLNCGGSGWVGPRRTQPATVPAAPAPADVGNGPQPPAPLDPAREEARRAAQAAGFMVIDTQAPAAV